MKITNADLALAARTIRGLSMDGVQKANSGHPGMPMGMADVAAVLFLKHLKHCPTSPDWIDRDRFVLSAGHGSMLLYSLLHLCGYGLSMEELQSFRQLDRLTPGHPEAGLTPGVEATAGPLGQGCGNAVGMALAEAMLAARFNTDDYQPIDHYAYAICGDGDLMEGVSHEAFSLAGHLGLNKLILFYDSNRITIEGSTDLAYSDDVKRRFQGYNWQVIEIDAHDYDQIDKAIRKAKRNKQSPSIIIARSHIGFGSPNKQGTSSAHGEPLGEAEVRATKEALGLPPDEFFYVPDALRDVFASRLKGWKRKASSWDRARQHYAAEHPEWNQQWKTFFEDLQPENLQAILPAFDVATPVATRSASGKIIQALAKALPQLVGGSADLAPSTKTLMDDIGHVGPNSFSGRNLHFGIREHGMGAILNGMALHGGLRTYGATFFVFADYFRPSIRLAALMELPVIYVLTHDSFYVGEDGPTHQPAEHIASLRCMPNVTVIRPAEATETAAAWVAAIQNRKGPTALLLTRQNLPVLDRSQYPCAMNVLKGAYTLWQSGEGLPELILIASGSEVALALAAAKQVADDANVRVVSMPSWELFEQQDAVYRNVVLPPACTKRMALEAALVFGWEKYVGSAGTVLGMHGFGASAPYKALEKKFGFTVENAVSMARALIAGD